MLRRSSRPASYSRIPVTDVTSLLTWKIIEGDSEDRQALAADHVRAFQRAGADHRPQDPRRISASRLDVNEQVGDAEVFLFKPVRIRLGIERDKQGVYPDKNRISRILPWRRSRRNRNNRHRRRQPRLNAWRRQRDAEHGGPRRSGSLACTTLVTGRAWSVPSGKAPATYRPMFELRRYQRAALMALEDYWRDGGGNPLVAMATATGKSVVIAHLIRDISRRYPALRVLVRHPRARADRAGSPYRCGHCGRTLRSGSTAPASVSVNGMRRSFSPGCRASGAMLAGLVRDTWC